MSTARAVALLSAASRRGWIEAPDPCSPDVGIDVGIDVGQVEEVLDRLVAGLAATGEPVAPALLGSAYEALLHPDARDAGAHYTPADVAAGLVRLALDGTPWDRGSGGHDACTSGPGPHPGPTVWDPTCGGGAFLLAAADALHAAGLLAAEVVGDLLWGTDLDPGAVLVAEAALRWWAADHGAAGASPGRHLAVADALLAPTPRPDGFDVVVGNPPFQGQLTGTSVRSAARTDALRTRWGAAVGPYTDTAAVALVAGAAALAPGGRLAMVLPASVLGARDAGTARSEAATLAPLSGLWVAGEPVFGAAVEVCAAVLARPTHPVDDHGTEPGSAPDGLDEPGEPPTARPSPVRRWRGRAFTPVAPAGLLPDAPSWAALALGPLGVPEPVVRTAGQVADLGVVSAGFRDEYYGLVDHVAEAPAPVTIDGPPGPWAPLVTSGLVDPGRVAWGERSVRFAKQAFARPAVDLRSLEAAGGRAATRVATLAVPKVVVATQTRVGEAAVDGTGGWVASTPTVTVVADPDVLWAIAAVVCSPVGSALALALTAGTGRSATSIRQSVASVGSLPLPHHAGPWQEGARALQAGDRDRFVDAMAAAYEVVDPEPLHRWWSARVPWPT